MPPRHPGGLPAPAPAMVPPAMAPPGAALPGAPAHPVAGAGAGGGASGDIVRFDPPLVFKTTRNKGGGQNGFPL